MIKGLTSEALELLLASLRRREYVFLNTISRASREFFFWSILKCYFLTSELHAISLWCWSFQRPATWNTRFAWSIFLIVHWNTTNNILRRLNCDSYCHYRHILFMTQFHNHLKNRERCLWFLGNLDALTIAWTMKLS